MRPPEIRQQEYELWQAYKAAKKLEETLELARLDKQAAQRIREEVAARLIDLGQPMGDL